MRATSTISKQRLHQRVERLQANLRARSDEEVAGALAEGHFRLALHPHATPAEAIQNLQAAHRIDGTNPRYAYHLARRFFLHGELDAAASWLKEAVCRCPTSHRLWTHVCILQRELNDRYRGKAEFEPDFLRRLAESTSTGIRNGQDAFISGSLCFVPPKSQAQHEAEARLRGSEVAHFGGNANREPEKTSMVNHPQAVRLVNAGQCRWSGIVDLEIEYLLEQEPSIRMRDRVLTSLEPLARLGRSRNGGSSGFAILAVQWLLSGYPVSTIRRLMAGQSEDPQDQDRKSTRLNSSH